jgi:hypothetical protein
MAASPLFSGGRLVSHQEKAQPWVLRHSLELKILVGVKLKSHGQSCGHTSAGSKESTNEYIPFAASNACSNSSSSGSNTSPG